MVRVRYSKTIPNPKRVMAKIGECREAMLEASHGVRPFGPAWHVLHSVTAAIGAVAAFITGERYYYGHSGVGRRVSPDAVPGLDLDEHPHERPATDARRRSEE